ncbi:MAG: hypothetical protein ACR2FG_12120 [Marmoricola sp.]
MTFRVLFVCAANICRSPTAASIFAGQLPANLTRAVTTLSAGTSAEPGKPWCKDARKWAKRHGLQSKDMLEHRSRRLTAAKVTRADLILAADTDVKSAILRMDLGSRAQLFTLMEAAALATGVQEEMAASRDGLPSRIGLQLQPLPHRVGEPRLHWLVGEMDAARGLVVIGHGSRSRGVDLPDLHGGRARATHRATLKTLVGAVSSLTATMSSISDT